MSENKRRKMKNKNNFNLIRSYRKSYKGRKLSENRVIKK